MGNLRVGRGGEIVLPYPVRNCYGLAPGTPVRIVKTGSGILLAPLTDAPMSAELEQEMEEWRTLGVQTWALFPYEADAQ